MFVTRGVLDETILKEMKKYMFPPKRKAVLIGMIVLFVVLGVASLFLQLPFWAILSGAMIVFILLVMRSASNKMIQTILNRMEETNGKRSAVYQTALEEDGVVVCNADTGATATVHYDTLVRFVDTTSAYVLLTRAWQFVVLFKESLTQEQQREMVAFLKTRPTQIRWKN